MNLDEGEEAVRAERHDVLHRLQRALEGQRHLMIG